MLEKSFSSCWSQFLVSTSVQISRRSSGSSLVKVLCRLSLSVLQEGLSVAHHPVLLFLGLFLIPRKTSKTPRIFLTSRTLKNLENMQKKNSKIPGNRQLRKQQGNRNTKEKKDKACTFSQFLQANKLARPIFNRSGAIQPRRRHATRAMRTTQMELKSTKALTLPEVEAAWIKVETVWGQAKRDTMPCVSKLCLRRWSCQDAAASNVMLNILNHSTGMANGRCPAVSIA